MGGKYGRTGARQAADNNMIRRNKKRLACWVTEVRTRQTHDHKM
jgi:hypothetical protein